jgi:hypothetical protein
VFNIVSLSGSAAGSSSATEDETQQFCTGEADGFSTAMGYLSSTMRLSGQVWCKAFVGGTMKRWKPLAATATGTNVATAV